MQQNVLQHCFTNWKNNQANVKTAESQIAGGSVPCKSLNEFPFLGDWEGITITESRAGLTESSKKRLLEQITVNLNSLKRCWRQICRDTPLMKMLKDGSFWFIDFSMQDYIVSPSLSDLGPWYTTPMKVDFEEMSALPDCHIWFRKYLNPFNEWTLKWWVILLPML